MQVTLKNGRDAYINSVGGDSDDLYAEEAAYVDNDEPVTDDDMDEINENHYDALYEIWLDKQISAAEYAYEGDR